MKKLTRIIIAIAVAGILFFVLYAQLYQTSREQKITLVDVVVVKTDVLPDTKIAKEDLEIQFKKVPEEIAKNYYTNMNDVINKYAKDRLYPGSIVHKNSVKTIQDTKPSEDLREVRVMTNVAAYAGVGKGDKVDIIYVDKMGVIETVGKLMYEGLEVKAVLNKAGTDLERLTEDKYNLNLEPGYVVFWVTQEMALEMETLQGTNEVVFKLAKWTDFSKELNTPHGVKTKELIIFDGDVPKEIEQDKSVEIGGDE